MDVQQSRRRPDRWSYHDFRQMELNAPPKECWELIDGIIHKMMISGSMAHNEIVGNLYYGLRRRLDEKKSPCRDYAENVRVVRDRQDLSTYPKITVRCGPRDFDQVEMSDPVFLVEVLSRSTGEKDRYDKSEAY